MFTKDNLDTLKRKMKTSHTLEMLRERESLNVVYNNTSGFPRVDLLEAYKLYSDYCDPLDIEFTADQELEILECIMNGLSYLSIMNVELTAPAMRRVKELMYLGVNIPATIKRDLVIPEDNLYILDLLIKLKDGRI